MNDNETLRELLEAALRKLEVAPGERATNEATTSCRTPASHPGLERFTIIESQSISGAAKPCFMEPARVCVNSGACEMRGY